MCTCDEATKQRIDKLKAEADRYWFIDPKVSVGIGDTIMAIAANHDCQWHHAFGMMVRGDGLKYSENQLKAWETLEAAGNLFRQLQDEVAWGRTVIGRLWMSVTLQRTHLILDDANHALGVFRNANEHYFEWAVLLNLGTLWRQLGDYTQATTFYLDSVELIPHLPEAYRDRGGIVYYNLGVLYSDLKQLDLAEHFLKLSEQPFTNIVQEDMQGHYLHVNALLDVERGGLQNALNKLQRAIKGSNKVPINHISELQTLAFCYLHLGRYIEAIDIAHQLAERHLASGEHTSRDYIQALHYQTLAYLGLARKDRNMRKRYLAAALTEIERAESAFEFQPTASIRLSSQLLKATVLLERGDYQSVMIDAHALAERLKSVGDVIGTFEAELLAIIALLRSGDATPAELELAFALCQQVRTYARKHGAIWLRYQTHLQAAQILEMQQHRQSAIWHYQAAALLVFQIQQDMAFTTRPHFLEEKDAAMSHVIRLYLESGRLFQAFESSELLRGQIFLTYLLNRDALRWRTDDPEVQILVTEYQRLRSAYSAAMREGKAKVSYVRTDADSSSSAPADTQIDPVVVLRRQLREVTEQLYWKSTLPASSSPRHMVTTNAIQARLQEGEALISYIEVAGKFWALVLDQNSVSAHPLPTTSEAIRTLISQLHNNLKCVTPLKHDDPFANALSHVAQLITQELFAVLMAPLMSRIMGCHRLFIVPYGALHAVPFAALYDGSCFLIQQVELVTLPAAGLLLQPTIARPRGATVIAYDGEQTLPGVDREAQMLHDLFGGSIFSGDEAKIATIGQASAQILHIAAHGRFDIERPELSHIQLADGSLMLDDVLQVDLPYELVVLSACETGLGQSSGGDEQIGLERSFLYAGANALISTLWSVNDASAANLMATFYAALATGTGKSAALQQAQCAIINEYPSIHLAFWGAFKLTGQSHPLSYPTSHVS